MRIIHFSVMKKSSAVILATAILVLLAGSYCFYKTPESIQIDTEYTGFAYKLNESRYGQEVTVNLNGSYNSNEDTFKGNLIINGREYTNCLLSSGVGILCYPEGTRNRYGQSYIGKDGNEITLEIENTPLYSEISEGGTFNENLIISIPAVGRSEAIEMNEDLKNAYYDKLEKKHS